MSSLLKCSAARADDSRTTSNNNSDNEVDTPTQYDPSTSYISRQRHIQQHKHQRNPILYIHGDALGVKEGDG